MVSSVDIVFQEALQLPEESRMELVERLIVSLPAENDVELEQLAAATRRLEEMKSGAVKGVSLEEMVSRVSSILSAKPGK